MSGQIVLGSLLACAIAAGSYVARLLTISGSIAALLLGIVVFGVGGWQWAVPMVTFFMLSSLLSKFGQARKADLELLFEKSSTRDWAQVAANGGVPGLVVMISVMFPLYDFYPLYLGALAAATADTWGTEIGILSKGATVSVMTFKPVESGSSGGVSESGTMGGALGAAVIAISGYSWYTELRTLFIVVVAGMAGSFADSLIGATLQAQFRCVKCGKITERRFHCGEIAAKERGVRWMRNDAVNLVCTLVGAWAAWLLLFVF